MGFEPSPTLMRNGDFSGIRTRRASRRPIFKQSDMGSPHRTAELFETQ